MEDSVTLCLNNFYVRYANTAFDKFEDIANQNNIELISNYYNTKFKREVLLSSSSLYNNIKDNFNRENVILSLLKYIIRSSTRCTPYSSLSGVSLGNFSKKNNFNISNLKLYFRVDNEWLMPIIIKLEQEIDNDIHVVLNNDIDITEVKLVNEWSTHYYEENNFETNEVIINNTEVVKKILKMTTEYIKKRDLVKILLNIYGEDKEKLVSRLIDQLLKYEILVSDLRLCPLINNPLEEIIKISSKNNYHCTLLDDLKAINKKLKQLNIDFSIDKYERLLVEMRKINDCKNIIRVDSFFDSKLSLDIKTKKCLEDYVNFILEFAVRDNKYIEHCGAFLDKFGNVKVPVKYAFDSFKGIGLPKKVNLNKSISENGKKLIHFLNERVKKQNSIDLSELQIKKISINDDVRMELALYPIMKNNEIYYITSPYGVSTNLFESFGRFNYIFNEDNSKYFKKNDYDYVEITYTPKKSRIQNVVNCTTDCEYYLEYTTNSQIIGKSRLTLDDICVCSDGNKFYYYNNQTGHQIRFNVNNKAMHDFMPPILNFILDSSQRQTNDYLYFFNLINNWLDGFDILPEIKYKNIIVSPQKWRFDETFLKEKAKNGVDSFCLMLDKKRKDQEIPNKVFFEYFDNRLLLDLTNPLHKKILFQQLKAGSNGLLVKNYFSNENLIATDNNGGKHVAEIMFQFNKASKNLVIAPNNLKFAQDTEHILLPFEEWIYFNIYIKNYFQDSFLIDYLLPFLSKEKSLLVIKDYFFV